MVFRELINAFFWESREIYKHTVTRSSNDRRGLDW
jgi:hypothetical protein